MSEKNYINEGTELGDFVLNMENGEKSSLEGAKVYGGETRNKVG